MPGTVSSTSPLRDKGRRSSSSLVTTPWLAASQTPTALSGLAVIATSSSFLTPAPAATVIQHAPASTPIPLTASRGHSNSGAAMLVLELETDRHFDGMRNCSVPAPGWNECPALHRFHRRFV